MSAELLPFTYRDHLYAGLAVAAVGSCVSAAGTALLIVENAIAPGFLATALGGLLVGAVGITSGLRQVTLQADGARVEGVLSTTSIKFAALRSIRLPSARFSRSSHRRHQQVVLRTVDGATLTLDVRDTASCEAMERWLELACQAVRSQWDREILAARPVLIGSKLRLEGSVLIRRKSRIGLRAPFDLREIPATQYASALMSLRAGGHTLLLDRHDENHLVLRRLVNEWVPKKEAFASSRPAGSQEAC